MESKINTVSKESDETTKTFSNLIPQAQIEEENDEEKKDS